jgi:hypothetical protein
MRYHSLVTRKSRTPVEGRSADHGDRVELDLSVLAQPDDTTCGPTSLHAVYRYWGLGVPLAEVISAVDCLPGGGTLAVSLACDALRRGFRATIYTYNLHVFDPTWFAPGIDLADRLKAQAAAKSDGKLAHATDTYLNYLSLGGKIRHAEMRSSLIRRYVSRGIPILTGLSATYLYGCAREHLDEYDDVRGEPTGHFVVLSGYDRQSQQVMVADPLFDNPLSDDHYYCVRMDRLIASILLGIVTYDANLLVIAPADLREPEAV